MIECILRDFGAKLAFAIRRGRPAVPGLPSLVFDSGAPRGFDYIKHPHRRSYEGSFDAVVNFTGGDT